jgi:predicted HTH transcriptional regulator
MLIDDTELLKRLRNTEDSFTERKRVSDLKDVLKVVVSFANSCPSGYPGVLFIGATDKGEVEVHQTDLDDLQRRTIPREIKKAYPPITAFTRTISSEGRECLAVIVPASPVRPHFAGPAFVRSGSEVIQASEDQFRILIAERLSKPFELRKHLNQNFCVELQLQNSNGSFSTGFSVMKLVDCNQFYCTFSTADATLISYPLSRLDLSYEHKQNLPKVEIRSTP